MSLIPIDVAMNHLKAELEDQTLIERKLAGAVEIAEQYMGRRIYADRQALNASQVAATAELPAVINLVTESQTTSENDVVMQLKTEINDARLYELTMQIRGVVINPAIEAAILLILGTLYAYREDVVDGAVAEIPIAATHRLQPFRVMGV